MTRAWPLLALAALAAGGCGQKGPLYLPDKGGKVVTSAPAATQAQPAPSTTAPAETAAAAAPAAATPAAAPKPDAKDKTEDQDAQPPK